MSRCQETGEGTIKAALSEGPQVAAAVTWAEDIPRDSTLRKLLRDC